MKLFGYPITEHDEESKLMSLEEVSLQCTIEELDKIIDYLSQKRADLINWANSRDKTVEIFPEDYSELQCPNSDNDSRALVLVSLKSVIDKYPT